MSRINDLIKELCPNGVNKYEIKDICKVTRGRVISKMELTENAGDYPVYSSQTLNNGVFGKINTYDFEGEYVQWTTDGANAGSIFYRNGKFSVTNVCGLLKIKDEYLDKIMTNYLAYALTMESKKYVNYATSNPKLMSNVMEKIPVLIPPLEVQEEIVRILDKFGELEAELEARRSQYEFWRGKLMSKEYQTYKLQDVLTIKNGKDYKHLESGDIPVYGSGGIMTYVNKYAYDKPSVLIPRKGSLGNVFYVDKPFWNVDTIYYTEIDTSKVIPKYVYYYIQNEHLDRLNIAGGVPSMTQATLNRLDIPLPSLEEQQRIVNILDKFDKLVNDISEGLPAEIEARRKQYEYYRNKLLSFEEVSCE